MSIFVGKNTEGRDDFELYTVNNYIDAYEWVDEEVMRMPDIASAVAI